MLTTTSEAKRPRRALIWLERAQAAFLSLGAVYLLAIAQLSPHPLPGLRWLACAVFAAGMTSAFRGSRFRRVATVLCFVGVACGCAAVGDIALVSSGAVHAKH